MQTCWLAATQHVPGSVQSLRLPDVKSLYVVARDPCRIPGRKLVLCPLVPACQANG